MPEVLHARSHLMSIHTHTHAHAPYEVDTPLSTFYK